jgi:hypothetical protein
MSAEMGKIKKKNVNLKQKSENKIQKYYVRANTVVVILSY